MPKCERAVTRTIRDVKGAVTHSEVSTVRDEQIEHGWSAKELCADWRCRDGLNKSKHRGELRNSSVTLGNLQPRLRANSITAVCLRTSLGRDVSHARVKRLTCDYATGENFLPHIGWKM